MTVRIRCIFGDQYVGSFLADHVNGGRNKETWNAWKHICVDHSQGFDAPDTKLAVKYCSEIIVAADFGRTTSA